MSYPTRRLTVERLEDRLTPATAGTLDPAFGTGGIVTLSSGAVGQLATAPDGHILALLHSGAFSSITSALERLNPDGTPDPTFGTGGVAPLPADYSTLTALPDGGALVGRLDFGPGGTTAAFDLVRVTPAGAVDPTFGSGGVATVVTPGGTAGGHLTAVVVQPDGRLLVAGDQTQTGTNSGQIVVARLTPSGQPDPTFGTGGVAVVPFSSASARSATAGDIALQPDGRIVVAGTGTDATRTGPAAFRLTPSGQLDPTFGAGGWVVVTFPQEVSGSFLKADVLPDGRVLLAGLVFTTAFNQLGAYVGAAARLTASGQLDPTYGAGGLAITSPFGSPAFTVSSTTAVDASGRVVFDTNLFYTRGDFNEISPIFRLTPDGAPDAGFGTNGQVTANTLPGLGRYSNNDLNLELGLAIRPNGDILLGGTDQASSPSNSGGLIVQLIGSNPPAGFVPAGTGTVVAGGAADGTFQVLAPTGGTYVVAGTVTAFPGFGGNVRVATADVNGDGTPDYVVGAGPGGAPEVTVYDGKTGALLADFPAFEPTFTGGVFVAAADLTGDGKAEVVVTPDQGGGGRVVVFTIAPGGVATLTASFFGIADPNFRGGARVAVGDVNRDGTPDVVVAAGFGGGPRVAIFDGKSVAAGSPARVVNDFFAFPGTDAVTLRNGAYVAAGDVTGDGYADLIFGGGPGGAPRVFVLSGAEIVSGGVAAAQASPVANFFVAGNTSDRGGVRVGTAQVSEGGASALVVGSGAGSPARVRIYPGPFTTPAEPSSFQDVAVFGGAVLSDGVYVD